MSEALIPKNTLFSNLTQLSVSPDTGNALTERDNGLYVPTVKPVDTTLLQAVNPIGSVIMFAGTTTPPTGWLFCHGQTLDRSQYSELFKVIGVTYGEPNNHTFKLPDYRNQFLRGNRDGRTLGSVEESTLGDHVHGFGYSTGGNDSYFVKGTQDLPNKDTLRYFWNPGEGGGRMYMIKDSGYNDFKHDIYSDGNGPLVTDAPMGKNNQELYPKNISVEYIIYTGKHA